MLPLFMSTVVPLKNVTFVACIFLFVHVLLSNIIADLLQADPCLFCEGSLADEEVVYVRF